MEFPEGRGGGVYSGSRFWKIQRGGGVIRKIPSVGGMDIFWNYTIVVIFNMVVFILKTHYPSG